jgi:protein-arginine kinase activator protein McsA
MALRVFCDSCQTFIKIAKMDEVSELKGPVICQNCLTKSSTYLKQVERVAGESINKINNVLDAAKAAFDDARHRLVDAQSKEN